MRKVSPEFDVLMQKVSPEFDALMQKFVELGDKDKKAVERFRAALKVATEGDMDAFYRGNPHLELFVIAACLWEANDDNAMEWFGVSEGCARWISKRLLCSWLFPFDGDKLPEEMATR